VRSIVLSVSRCFFSLFSVIESIVVGESSVVLYKACGYGYDASYDASFISPKNQSHQWAYCEWDKAAPLSLSGPRKPPHLIAL
jgi:hypothetical protein